ncbi:MAG: SOS response-associated peptidase [Solirubrobacteraceae bacterium]
MCGRYTLAGANPAEVRSRFGLAESIEVRRRFNVAPGDDVFAVNTDREGHPRGEMLRWGLVPSWSERPDSGPKMINARAETVAEKPSYRTAFERWRCLVIADGFYEWRRRTDGSKQAFHIQRADGQLFAFAGLWSVWHAPEPLAASYPGGKLRSCTILTTVANAVIAALHDRMPVILSRDAEAEWLHPSTPRQRLPDLLAGLPADQISVRPVGPAVNDARYDGPQCLVAPLQSTQPALF